MFAKGQVSLQRAGVLRGLMEAGENQARPRVCRVSSAGRALVPDAAQTHTDLSYVFGESVIEGPK